MSEKQLFGPCRACGAYFDSRENAEAHVQEELAKLSKGKTALAKKETRLAPAQSKAPARYEPTSKIGRKLQGGMQKVSKGVDTLQDVCTVINTSFDFDAALGLGTNGKKNKKQKDNSPFL